MSDVEIVNEELKRFTEEAKKLKENLENLRKYNNVGELESIISLGDYAQLNASLAYCLNSLYYMYMKTNGISFEDHKIHGEINRIKEYFERVQEVVTNERIRKNPHIINTDAARRMIRAHLIDSEQQQMQNEEDLWKMEEEEIDSNKNSKTAQNRVQKIEQDLEVKDKENESSEEELEQTVKSSKKGNKKLHKGSLLASGGHISWKDEIEKMLK